MNKEDLARQNELKARVWAHTARKLLKGKENPTHISDDKIEQNRGRKGKAHRLLKSYVVFSHNKENKNTYSTYREKIYEVLRFDESNELSEQPMFEQHLERIHDAVFSYTGDEQVMFDTIQYRDINGMKDNYVLYIYWHQDEYSLIKVGKKVYAYPKALMENLTKLMLRSIIEQYLHTNFHSWIEKRLSLPEGSVKTDDHFSLSIRNFAAHGYRFSMEAIFGKNGFRDEYVHFMKYFEALVKNLNDFNQVVENSGGYDALVKIFREEIISELIRQAPLHAFSDIPDSTKGTNIEWLFKHPHLYTYILNHSGMFEYDTLYANDQSILVIDSRDRCYQAEETLFVPNEEECAMIEDRKRKDEACTALTT